MSSFEIPYSVEVGGQTIKLSTVVRAEWFGDEYSEDIETQLIDLVQEDWEMKFMLCHDLNIYEEIANKIFEYNKGKNEDQ